MINGVVFDFHSTLVDGGDADEWISSAFRYLGTPSTLDDGLRKELRDFLDHIWQHAAAIDPASGRDLSPDRHREVFTRTVAKLEGIGPDLTDALYAVMTDQWVAFDDAAPVLRGLKEQGLRIAVLSNVGIDIRGCMNRNGLSDLVDEVVMSYEVGIVKPDPAIFALTLDRLGTTGPSTLMVGDSARDDVGGASLGIRTLILPRTRGPVHGLDAVSRLCWHNPWS
jgi:FMN phosphatase YigB (HAD superfamily)